MSGSFKEHARSKLPIAIQSLLYMAIGNFANSAYSPLSSAIKSAYILTSEEVGFITSSVFIGSLTVSFLSGFFVDRLGNRIALRISFGLIATGALICAFSSTYPVLLSGFFLIGLGYGSITPATNSLVMEEYYPEHIGRMGIKQTGVPIGSIASVILLPIVAITFGIRWPFIILFATSIIIAIAVKSRPRPSNGFRFRTYFSDLLSAARDRRLLTYSAFSSVLSWGQQTGLTFYVLYFVGKGFSLYLAEILLGSFLVGAVFGRIFWARMGYRIHGGSRWHATILIMFLSGFLYLMLTLVPSSIIFMLPYSILLGMNAAGWNSTFVTAVSEMAGKDRVGLYSGVALITLGLGTIIGAPVSGYIRDSTGSYFLTWVVLGGVQIITSILMLSAYILHERRESGVVDNGQ
ncbi:MAG: MFS transporter [Candidatus Thermoplasmatota archaeon]|nr:MFS transporter [Candidatus Thermoplasmatota archaeon]